MKTPLATLLAAVASIGMTTLGFARVPETMPPAISALMAPALPLRTEAVPGFRQVTRLGTTKPAGAPLDGRLGTKPSLDVASRGIDRLIRTGVCIGC